MIAIFRSARFLFVLVLLTAGCATSGGASGGTSGSDLERAELEELQSGTLHDAIRRFRPSWLRNRAPDQEVVVVVDGMRQGGVETLRQIAVTDVQRVRFLSASDATTAYGTGVWGGVIEVERRR